METKEGRRGVESTDEADVGLGEGVETGSGEM